MGAFEGTGDLLKGGRGATIAGIPIAHSSGDCRCFYYQRGVLITPDEALDELLQALGRLGLSEKDARIEPIEGTGLTEVRVSVRRATDLLIEDLGGTIPVDLGYILFPATHVKGFAARRPVPAPRGAIPRRPLVGKGAHVNIGVVDLGFFDPQQAGHPTWAAKDVVLDQTIPVPGPGVIHPSYIGHGNAIIGILKQLAPAAKVYASTIATQASDAPGGTSDRRLAEAIDRLLAKHRIHILVVPFGGSTRHGSMPVTERVLESYGDSTLVVASAGNDGVDATMYPAVDPGVVGTGAWKRQAGDLGWLRSACETVGTPFDYLGKLTLADWSNKGSAAQLGAPGVAVPAPFVTGKLKIRSGSLDRPEGVKEAAFAGWAMFTGTSFAAAVAAGCIAGTVSGKCPPSPERLVAAVLK